MRSVRGMALEAEIHGALMVEATEETVVPPPARMSLGRVLAHVADGRLGTGL